MKYAPIKRICRDEPHGSLPRSRASLKEHYHVSLQLTGAAQNLKKRTELDASAHPLACPDHMTEAMHFIGRRPRCPRQRFSFIDFTPAGALGYPTPPVFPNLVSAFGALFFKLFALVLNKKCFKLLEDIGQPVFQCEFGLLFRVSNGGLAAQPHHHRGTLVL